MALLSIYRNVNFLHTFFILKELENRFLECAKNSGLEGRKLSHISLILGSLRSSNREDFRLSSRSRFSSSLGIEN